MSMVNICFMIVTGNFCNLIYLRFNCSTEKYTGEAWTHDNAIAGFERNRLDTPEHTGTVKLNTCFDYLNIKIVKHMWGIFAMFF